MGLLYRNLTSTSRVGALSTYLGEKTRIIKLHMITFAIIMLAGISVLTWFRGFLIYHWDTVFPFNPIAMMKAFFWPWSDLISTGTPVLGNAALPYFALIYFLRNVLGLSELSSQILLYYFLLVMGGASMYIFFVRQSVLHSEKTRQLRFGALASALVYMFNPYSMVYVWMVFSLEAFLYASLPILLLLFQSGLARASSGRIDWKIIGGLAGVTLFASPALGNPAFSIPVMIGFTIFYLLWLLEIGHLRKWRSTAEFLILTILALIATNFWWIYPTTILYGSQLVRAGGASYGAVGLADLVSNSVHTDYFNVFRLFGMFPLYNSENYPHYDFAWMYQNFFVITLISMILPIIAFLGLILRRINVQHHSKSFAALCVIGIVPIAAGLQPPFQEAFAWIALNVPGVSTLFRDPYQKFGFWLPFGYAFLIGATFSVLSYRVPRKADSPSSHSSLNESTWSHRRVFALGLILVLITSGCVWPMFTGDVIPTETPSLPSPRIEIPDYYYQAASWLQSQQGSFRILSLPEDQILQSSLWSHGYAGSDILRYLTGDSIISTSPQVPNLDVFQHSLYAYISTGGGNLSKVLKLLDVKFVLLRTDAGFYPALTLLGNFTELRAYLEGQPGIITSRQFGPLLFFEVTDYGPKLFATDQTLTLNDMNSVGWDLHDYSGGWQENSLNDSQQGSLLSLMFDPHGAYSYGFLASPTTLNVSIPRFPYIKVSFSSGPNAALLLRVDLKGKPSVFLTALDSGNATSYRGNHYSSVSETSMVFDLSGLSTYATSLYLYVTNAPDPTSQSTVTVTISELVFESFISQPGDYIRAVAQQPQSPTSFVIVEKGSGGGSGGAAKDPIPIVRYNQLDPMDYDVKVINANSSFVLTLSETFDPLWHLAGSLPFDSSRVDHEMVDGFANGWMINILGNFSFSIVYGPGRSVIWSYIGSLLSGLTLTTGVIVATALSRAKRNTNQRIPHPKQDI